ncbi:MAG: PadR family transcriptional regulator [Chloroflexota bacterium]
MDLPRRPALGLAVLVLLYEHPMHPYEMQHHIRERGLDEVIKLKAGTLYSTVERLCRKGLVEPLETSRDGKRPERTVYGLTDAGRIGLLTTLQDFLSRPSKEYPAFTAGLAFLGAVPPDEALGLLQSRLFRLEVSLAGYDTMLKATRDHGLPKLFSVETEYSRHMVQAELDWTRRLVQDIETGELSWPDEVLELHQHHELGERAPGVTQGSLRDSGRSPAGVAPPGPQSQTRRS